MSFEQIDDPRAPIKGEMPYESPQESIVSKIRRKLGPQNIAGIIGALTTPEGIIDRSGQRVGLSPFQAGLAGFQQGSKGYEKEQIGRAMAVAGMGLRERDIAAQELSAEAAMQRANAYTVAAAARAAHPGGYDPVQRKKDILDLWNKMTPEQRQAGIAAGIFPHPQAATNEDRLAALARQYQETYGMSEDEARTLASYHPLLAGSTTGYTIQGNNAFEQSNTRKYSYSAPVISILRKYNLNPDTFFGSQAGAAPGPGTYASGLPQSELQIQMADDDQLEAWLLEPDLPEDMRQAIQTELEDRASQEGQ